MPESQRLGPGQRANPIVWITRLRGGAFDPTTDVSDAALEPIIGAGTGRALKSSSHDADGVHFLCTRHGTAMHTDLAYKRYSCQLVLRNDGNRIRGLDDTDQETRWHQPMVPGVMYCLDTHSPHQGLPDPRFHSDRKAMTKVVIAVDRDQILQPPQAWELLRRLLSVQLHDVSFGRAPIRA